jgi:hypothetical protein
MKRGCNGTSQPIAHTLINQVNGALKRAKGAGHEAGHFRAQEFDYKNASDAEWLIHDGDRKNYVFAVSNVDDGKGRGRNNRGSGKVHMLEVYNNQVSKWGKNLTWGFEKNEKNGLHKVIDEICEYVIEGSLFEAGAGKCFTSIGQSTGGVNESKFGVLIFMPGNELRFYPVVVKGGVDHATMKYKKNNHAGMTAVVWAKNYYPEGVEINEVRKAALKSGNRINGVSAPLSEPINDGESP